MNITLFVNRIVRELLNGQKGKSLVAIAGAWGTLVGSRMIYPVLLPHLRESFNLSLTVAGFLITILLLGSALGQLPGGILADRYSERLVMIASAVIVAIALGFVSIVPSPLLLFIATGAVGVGQSLYPIARITILSDIYPDHLGSALGVTMATGDLGQTILPPIAGVLAVALTWQAGMTFLVPLLLLAAVCLWAVLPAKTSAGSSVTLSSASTTTLLSSLRQPNMAYMILILFLYILTWHSFTGFFPTYLVQEKGMSSSSASILFSAFFAFGIIVKPLSGAAYDRLGMRKSLIFVLLGPIIGLGLLPLLTEFWALATATALVSTMLGSGAITQSFLADTFPRRVRGTGLGIIRTSVSAVGATGPIVFGYIGDAGYFDEGYLILAGILVVVVILTINLPRQFSDQDEE
ncbi:MFS transporter [Halobellus rubicundus]|uniref:Nitrate/nitrite transporter n=1 Tax=Halobellus rubicundus TaxID=2996466 RepID=A0ABD5MEX9_9EURY